MTWKKSSLGPPLNVRLCVEHYERVKAMSEASDDEDTLSDVLRSLVAEAFAARDNTAIKEAPPSAQASENQADSLHWNLEQALLNLMIDVRKSKRYLQQLTALSVLLRHTHLPAHLDGIYRQLCDEINADAGLSEIEETCAALVAKQHASSGDNHVPVSDDVLGLDLPG